VDFAATWSVQDTHWLERKGDPPGEHRSSGSDPALLGSLLAPCVHTKIEGGEGIGMERSTPETDERVAQLQLALDDLRAATAVEALELRAQLRAVQQRVRAIEGSREGGDPTAEGLNERRRRIADAKAKLSPEDIDRIRQERAGARAAKEQRA
jgi:hypothetical protein